jgi:AAA15 family ATPase/GTPase
MAIKRVEIKDFLVFKGEFAADFCPGVNVIIGGNGTGKTTLLKTLSVYPAIDILWGGKVCADNNPKLKKFRGVEIFPLDEQSFDNTKTVYIPEKDILEHAKGLLPFITQKETGFSNIYRDILIAAQDVPSKEQSKLQKEIRKIISEKIGGEVIYDINGGEFVTVRTDGTRIPFSHEASGFKKMGLLGLLVKCGQLEKGSVLFWDEPENSLNPELVPVLVNILLELSRNGVQIFIATHDYNLVRYFDVRRDRTIPVAFHNLTKVDERILCNSSLEYIKLSDNLLEKASADLFDAVVDAAMEGREDE